MPVWESPARNVRSKMVLKEGALRARQGAQAGDVLPIRAGMLKTSEPSLGLCSDWERSTWQGQETHTQEQRNAYDTMILSSFFRVVPKKKKIRKKKKGSFGARGREVEHGGPSQLPV